MSLSLRASAYTSGTAQGGDADEPSPVQQRLRRILEGADFPALSKQIVDTVSALEDDATSLQRLANVVLREYSLTLGVVRTANSVHYRRGNRAIQSATHAMMMLGAKVVRQIAGSLLLFENYSKKSPALKELMLLSLLTANHARAAAMQLGLMEPEEAHLCGMFRNLGEVLVAGHFQDEYARIQERIADGKNENAACKEVLGFPFADLGVEVCRHWGMPDVVTQGIRARAAAAASRTASVTAFSHDLTQALYRLGTDEAAVLQAVDVVLEQHGARVKLTREQVGKVVSEALQETRELFVSPQIATDRMRFQQLTRSAHAALGDAVQTGEEDADSPRASHHATLRVKLRQELDDRVHPGSGAGVGEVLMLALETILRGGPFDRVLACFLSPDRTRLTARTALGEGAEALAAKFDFPVSVRGGPIVSLTQQRAAVYVPTDRALTTIEHRFAYEYGLRQFGVFPIIVQGKVVGCIYCDRTETADSPDRATVRFVKSVVDQVVEGIVRRRV